MVLGFPLELYVFISLWNIQLVIYWTRNNHFPSLFSCAISTYTTKCQNWPLFPWEILPDYSKSKPHSNTWPMIPGPNWGQKLHFRYVLTIIFDEWMDWWVGGDECVNGWVGGTVSGPVSREISTINAWLQWDVLHIFCAQEDYSVPEPMASC